MIGLVQLDLVAGWVVEEHLLARALGVFGPPILHAFNIEVGAPRIDVVDLECEMLHRAFGRAEGHEMYLLGARIEPGPREPKIRAVDPLGAAKFFGVEHDRFGHISHAERNMVDPRERRAIPLTISHGQEFATAPTPTSLLQCPQSHKCPPGYRKT